MPSEHGISDRIVRATDEYIQLEKVEQILILRLYLGNMSRNTIAAGGGRIDR